MLSDRYKHEISHGKKITKDIPELIWGWGTPAGKERAKRRGQIIASKANLAPGKRILEIGCGTGLFTEMFSQTGATITAVDISPELLELARLKNLPAEKVQFIEQPFEECSLDQPFDAIIGSSILHHLDIESSLKKIFMLLKPGGIMSFAEPNMLNPQIAIQKNVVWFKERLGDSPDETAFIRWRLHALLSKIGFQHIELTPFDWLHPSTPEFLIDVVSHIGAIFERIPIIREFAGSLHIKCQKP
jgi:SAM-dependent methyltransferase